MKLIIILVALLINLYGDALKISIVNVSDIQTKSVIHELNKQLHAHYKKSFTYHTVRDRMDESLIANIFEDYKDAKAFFAAKDKIFNKEDYYYVQKDLDKIYSADIIIYFDIDKESLEENTNTRVFYKYDNQVSDRQFFVLRNDINIIIDELFTIVQKINKNQPWSKL